MSKTTNEPGGRIKNLLFDLGGVIMQIDRKRCEAAFRSLGFEDVGDYLGDYGQKGAFAALEAGEITAGEFRAAIRRHIAHEVSDREIDAAFEAFLIGIPLERLHELEELRKHYNIYLLSNTNPIMWNGFIAESFREDGKDIGRYFDGMVTSFEARCMKPSPKIFSYCSEKLGIEPGETLFFDDSEANCEAARRCGFHAARVRGFSGPSAWKNLNMNKR